MKKMLVILLVLTFIVSAFAGCDNGSNTNNNTLNGKTEIHTSVESFAGESDTDVETSQSSQATENDTSSHASQAPENDTSNQTSQAPDNNVPSVTPNNSAYDAIFNGTTIVHLSAVFGINTKSFALKNQSGEIMCLDYAYNGDTIDQFVQTNYVPIPSGSSDREKEEKLNNAKANLDEMYGKLKCCTVTCKMLSNYYVVSISFSDMDNPDNYSELYSAGVITTLGPTSMSKTESGLLSQGYAKK